MRCGIWLDLPQWAGFITTLCSVERFNKRRRVLTHGIAFRKEESVEITWTASTSGKVLAQRPQRYKFERTTNCLPRAFSCQEPPKVSEAMVTKLPDRRIKSQLRAHSVRMTPFNTHQSNTTPILPLCCPDSIKWSIS